MANQFLDAQEYANTMLLLAKNQLVTGKLVRGTFSNQVTDENGLSIDVKRPPRFVRNDAAAFNANLELQNILTGSTNVRVNQYAKVHISVGDIEYVQSYNQLMQNETMKSAAQTLAHQMDSFLQTKVAQFTPYIGAAGGLATDGNVPIASPQDFNRVHTRLMNYGVPNTDLCATVLFDDAERIRGNLIGTNIDTINRNALEKVRVPILSEIDVYATQQCPSVTNGTRVAGGTTAITTASAKQVNYRDVKDTMTMTIGVEGQSTGATFRVGEKFTIAGVFAYDWRDQKALPFLQTFTILGGTGVALGSPLNTTITSGASGAADLIISPPIIVPGTNDGVSTAGNTAFGTCTAAPTNGAIITHLGAAGATRRVRAAWHKGAITMVSARLQRPFVGESSFATDRETGISIRYWRGSDITTGAHIHRWDAIYGATNLDPLMGAEVSGG
jgi:hypothetical protein